MSTQYVLSANRMEVSLHGRGNSVSTRYVLSVNRMEVSLRRGGNSVSTYYDKYSVADPGFPNERGNNPVEGGIDESKAWKIYYSTRAVQTHSSNMTATNLWKHGSPPMKQIYNSSTKLLDLYWTKLHENRPSFFVYSFSAWVRPVGCGIISGAADREDSSCR